MPDTIDVSRLIDEGKLTSFHALLTAVSFLVVMSDGYDITAAGFVAPHLIAAWHITQPAALGPIFSASLFGMLIGAPALGFLGDRSGRKAAILLSCFILSLFTFLAAASNSLQQLFYLRLAAGVGIGGLMPNLVALNDEYAPRRFRATLIILMFTGVTVGAALPGGIAVWLVPIYGWRSLFVFGGLLPMLMLFLVLVFLPESLKFLALRERTRAPAIRLAKRVLKSVEISPGTHFHLPEQDYPHFSLALLFNGPLAYMTPLLWLCFAANLMGYYFLVSWVPTILGGKTTLSVADAALAGALIQIGGAIGSWSLMRAVDARGFLPIAFYFALAFPCVAAIGFAAESSRDLAFVVVFLAGFAVLGVQLGINAGSALIYPTAFRANGSGWAFGIGRVGSVVGPLLGGILIQWHLPLQYLFVMASLPFAFGAVACFVLARLYRPTP